MLIIVELVLTLFSKFCPIISTKPLISHKLLTVTVNYVKKSFAIFCLNDQRNNRIIYSEIVGKNSIICTFFYKLSKALAQQVV